MINSPAQPRPPAPIEPANSLGNNGRLQAGVTKLTDLVYGHDRDYKSPASAPAPAPAPARTLEDVYPAAATAAVALAQLHNHKAEAEWNSEVGCFAHISSLLTIQRNHARQKHSSPSAILELPSIQDHLAHESRNSFHSPRPRELLPSIMSRSPPGRSTTLPPIQRPRPRKSSMTQNARKPRHERTKSKDQTRRMSIEGRKAFSAEPQTAAAEVMNKRWEELVDAATSVADSDRDLTPVCGFQMARVVDAAKSTPISSSLALSFFSSSSKHQLIDTGTSLSKLETCLSSTIFCQLHSSTF